MYSGSSGKIKKTTMNYSPNSVNDRKLPKILLAIVLAVAIWIMLNGSPTDINQQDINAVPVTFINTEMLREKNLTIEDNRNYYVNLGVKGTTAALMAINRDEITAEVDLKSIDREGVYEPEIEIRGLSNSIVLEKVNPQKIKVTVSDIIDSSREVEVIAQGKPADGLKVIHAQTSEKIHIIGPEESIGKVEKAVAIVSVNDLSDDSLQYPQVKLYDKEGEEIEGLQSIPQVVEVEVRIGTIRKIPVKPPLTIGLVESGYRVTNVTVSPETLMVGAKQDVLDQISEITMDPISVVNKTRTFTQSVQLNHPENAFFIDQSNEVAVTVEVEGILEKGITIDKIVIENLGEGLNVIELADSSVVLRIAGAPSQLNELKSEQLTAYIDLSNLDKGEHEVPIRIRGPAHIEVKRYNPQMTKVIIGTN